MAKDKRAKTASNAAGKHGRLLTVACVALVVVGLGVMAYPFVMIAVEEHNKDEIVAQLEQELPIHRAEEEFEPLDEAMLAAMPVVPVPQWTSEEVASANAMLEGNSAELIAQRPLATPLPTLKPKGTPRPTEAPQPNVEVIYDEPVIAPVGGQSLLASLPDPQTIPPFVATVPDGRAAITAQESRVLGATDEDKDEGNDGGEAKAIAAEPAPASAAAIGEGQRQVAATVTDGQTAQMQASASQDFAGLLAAGEANSDEALAASAPVIALPKIISPAYEPGVTVADTAVFAQEPLSSADPRTTLQLRDAAPVYYEDFANILSEATEVHDAIAAFTVRGGDEKVYDSPTELTVASIKHQIESVRTLLAISRTMPSASSAVATFQGAGGAHQISLVKGAEYLSEDLSMLNGAMDQLSRVMFYPRAHDLIQNGFDRTAALTDQTLNLLDYMAQSLSQEDINSYLRSRSASMVGETEAVYLLEVPSVGLRVGCFPNTTFEQMYKSMRKGAALFPRVGMPNTNTNISVAGHRNGTAAFFKDMGNVKAGDIVLLHTRGLGSFRYMVERTFFTYEDDWTPLHALGYPSLTLVSCEPFDGVTHGRRIMAHCKLIGIAR